KIEKVEKVEEKDPDLYMKRAESFLRRGSDYVNQALKECDKAIKFSDYDANYIYEKFRILFYIKDYKGCLDLYKQFTIILSNRLTPEKHKIIIGYYLYCEYECNGIEVKEMNFKQGRANWYTGSDRGKYDCFFDKDGNYNLINYRINYMSRITSIDCPQNYMLKFAAKLIFGNRCGFVFDINHNGDKHFEINDDRGAYRVCEFANNDWIDNDYWHKIDSYQKNKFNNITVIKNSHTYYFFINRNYITEIRSDYKEPRFAFSVITEEDPPARVKLKGLKMVIQKKKKPIKLEIEDKIILTCGKCGQNMRVRRTYRKARITCPKCNTKYTVNLDKSKYI
ncbi:MAG: hypothetical protein ACOCRK_11360, partial [bacterium]